MNHTVVAATSCATCHNGALSTGIPSGHRGGMAPGACNTCHNSTAWRPASFSHANVAPGTCATCHGVSSTGIPANHKGGTNRAAVCDS
ncbi:MAG: hypothetical protein K8R65_09405, partial [Nitrospirae bacterium]|nr:hypothetical protein [Nitrospirota bacterium]